MIIRTAQKKDCKRILELLGQVLDLHAGIRPDIFIAGTTKYTEGELEKMLTDGFRRIFVAVDECDSVLGYAFCEIREQPFSNNMLRPCPVLDNPGAISKMVAETGAYSTEMQHPESANDLFDKTIEAAKAWKVKADELFDRDEYIKNHVKDENMYNYEKDDSERDFNEFEKTEA